MKNLNKSEKVAEVSQALDADTTHVVSALQAQVERLQNILVELLIRAPEDVDADVNKQINILRNTDKSILSIQVERMFGPHFWVNEADTDFKVKLAEEILKYMRTVYPGYTNNLLSGISNRDMSYHEYLNNFIFSPF